MLKDHDEAFNTDLNLASLASRAAIALDFMSLGREYNRDAIVALARHGPELVEGAADRSTMLAVYSALRPESGRTDASLTQGLSDAAALFDALLHLDSNVDRAELGRLRAFCVILSRSASALLPSPFEFEA